MAGIGLTIAGAVLGTMLWKSHGVLGEIGGAVIGGLAGLAIGLNAGRMVEVVVIALSRLIRRNPTRKKSDRNK